LFPVCETKRARLAVIGYPLFTASLVERSLLINVHSNRHYFTGRRSCRQRHRWKHSEPTDNKRKHRTELKAVNKNEGGTVTEGDAQLDTQQWRQQGNNASGGDARHTLQTVRCRRHTTAPVEAVSFFCECTLSETDLVGQQTSHVLLGRSYCILCSGSTCKNCRSQRPRGLRHELPSLTRTLGSWVRIPLEAWMSVLCAFILCLCCSVCR
jgi:hypothetical protein